MPNWSFNDLWCDVVGCTAHGSFLFVSEFQFGSQTEISDFYFHGFIQKNISQFQIAMDYTIWVHVLNGGNELVHEVPGLLWSKLLSFFDHFAHSLWIQKHVLYFCTTPEWCTRIWNLQRHCRIQQCNADEGFYEFLFLRGADLHKNKLTFCFALFFCNVFLSMTLIAYKVLVSRLTPS